MQFLFASPVEAVSGAMDGQEGPVIMPRKTPGNSKFLNYGRSNFVPNNPQTTAQVNVRNLLALSSAGYKALTAAQASNWSTLGKDFQLDGRLDTVHGLYGIQAYNLINMYRLLDGQSQVAVAPAYAEPIAPTMSGAAIVGGNIEITISHDDLAGSFFAVRITPNLGSAVRQARKNELRYITTAPADSIIATAASPQTIILPMNNFTLATGEWTGIEIVHLNSDYMPSEKLFVRNIVLT